MLSPETLAAIRALRDLGATRVQFGDVTVEFGPLPVVPERLPAPAADDDDDERMLMWSADA